MAMQSRKNCALCGSRKFGIWALTTDCSNCRKQWKAFYAGRTQVSPLMRAIAAEQVDRAAKSRVTRSATRRS